MVKKNTKTQKRDNVTGRLCLCSIGFRVSTAAIILAFWLESEKVIRSISDFSVKEMLPRIILACCYLASWVTALIALRHDKKSRFARILVYVYGLILLFELVFMGSMASLLRG